LHLLFLKRGILDGRAGITFARMKAVYETMASTYVAAGKLMPTGEHLTDYR
jgi:hypothetical protein